MSCTVSVTADEGRTCIIDVDPNEPIEDSLMVLVEVELAIPIHQQRLFNGSAVLDSKKSLAAQGIAGPAVSLTLRNVSPNEPQDASRLVEQLFAAPPPQQQQQQQRTHQSPAPSSGGAPMVPSPQQATSLINQLFGAAPAAGGGGGAAAAQPMAMPDENDPDVQIKLLKQIEQQNIMQNMEQAIEHTPEAFGRVVMLYVPSTVNNVPLTAFVDSGAQMTIMNEATAERCGILRLLDRRMAGVAKGVGTSKILGRIHMAMVNLGGVVVPMSITVLESQDMEFLIGLDQLRRHQMSIDLKDNSLKIANADNQTVSIPFLGEGELPDNLRAEDRGGAPGDDNDKQQSAAAPAGGGAAAASNEKLQLTAEQQEKVKRLQELSGADAATVVGALEASGWQEDAAASFLFE